MLSMALYMIFIILSYLIEIFLKDWTKYPNIEFLIFDKIRDLGRILNPILTLKNFSPESLFKS